MGCMAQSRGQELIDKLPDVDLVLGTQKFHRTADYLDEIIAGKREKIVDVAAEEKSEATIREHLLNGSAKTSVSAFVSIMQGCNQYCTFCIVPYTRGEERSRTIPDIVAECRELVARGVREITLLGQIVTSYGKRDDRHSVAPQDASQSAFVQLLEAVHEIDGLERIRFTSPHPKGYGDDLVEAYARLPKLCESAHIPAAKRQRPHLEIDAPRLHARKISRHHRKIARAPNRTSASPPTSSSAFPARPKKILKKRCRSRAKCEFDNAYIFKYSPRRDTPAAEMPDQVPQEIREERNQRLLESGQRNRRAQIRRLHRAAGADSRGRAEQEKCRRAMTGRTRCNKIVLFDGSERHRGQLMDVKIDAHRLLHALRRPGDCEFVNQPMNAA